MRRTIQTCYCIVGWALESHAQIIKLGTAATFGALAPAGVTNTGSTIVNGNVGSTGTSITGFPPGLITGTFEISNDVAAQAQADFNAAYVQGTNLAPTTDQAGLATLSGLNLTAGVYKFDTGVTLDGTLTLSGGGDFVFQLASTLTTMSGSRVVLTNGASACNVYWIVGSAATIGTSSNFAGNVLAYTAITLTTSATVQGGLYARSAVTLDSNLVNACDPAASATTTASPTSLATFLPVPSTTATVIASPTTYPTPPNAISTTTSDVASPIIPAAPPSSALTTTPATASTIVPPARLVTASPTLPAGLSSPSTSTPSATLLPAQSSTAAPTLPAGLSFPSTSTSSATFSNTLPGTASDVPSTILFTISSTPLLTTAPATPISPTTGNPSPTTTIRISTVTITTTCSVRLRRHKYVW